MAHTNFYCTHLISLRRLYLTPFVCIYKTVHFQFINGVKAHAHTRAHAHTAALWRNWKSRSALSITSGALFTACRKHLLTDAPSSPQCMVTTRQRDASPPDCRRLIFFYSAISHSALASSDWFSQAESETAGRGTEICYKMLGRDRTQADPQVICWFIYVFFTSAARRLCFFSAIGRLFQLQNSGTLSATMTNKTWEINTGKCKTGLQRVLAVKIWNFYDTKKRLTKQQVVDLLFDVTHDTCFTCDLDCGWNSMTWLSLFWTNVPEWFFFFCGIVHCLQAKCF